MYLNENSRDLQATISHIFPMIKQLQLSRKSIK